MNNNNNNIPAAGDDGGGVVGVVEEMEVWGGEAEHELEHAIVQTLETSPSYASNPYPATQRQTT